MAVNYVFERCEVKFLLTSQQYQTILQEVQSHLVEDEYGETTIQSIYYDTHHDLLIRRSDEKPLYKEKLRLRCYGLNDCDKDVYLEIKKKYDGIVYKRRIAVKEQAAARYFSSDFRPQSQMGREIRYFAEFYEDLQPKMLILYDRTAYHDPNSDLRITFDRNIRYRTEDVNLHSHLGGIHLLPKGTVLMEIKSATAFPLWLCRRLSEEQIFKTSFSKYSTAYQRELRASLNR